MPINKAQEKTLQLDGDESELDFSYDEDEFPNDELDQLLQEFNSNYTLDTEIDNSNINNVLTDNNILPMITSKKNIKWIQQPFNTPNIELDDLDITDPVIVLRNPIDYFMHYCNDYFFETLAFNTNLYAIQKNLTNFKATNQQEIRVLIAIHLIMGCLKFPRVRMYWEENFKVPSVFNSMSRDRFFQLRQNLHIINNLDIPNNNHDKFVKIRPLYDLIKKKCNELPKERNLCIDEQMVPFKGKLSVKQYMRGKPCPWGVKIFVLASENGMIYDFILYQGSSTELSQHNLNLFGLGASVVLHLVHTLYNLGIYAAGTVRPNRFAKPPLLLDKQMAKLGRGATFEIRSDVKNLFSIGLEQLIQYKDMIKKKEYITVERPEIVKLYNSSMGGVDKSDQLISFYRTFIKSKKWTLRLITHAFDLVASNSWLQYKKDATELCLPKKKILDLLHFRLQLADELIRSTRKIVTAKKSKVGRPTRLTYSSPNFDTASTSFSHLPSPSPTSSSYSLNQTKSRTDSPIASDAVRYDRIYHMPQMDSLKNATKCKNPTCSRNNRTHFFCKKCNVHLCLTRDRNCFEEYHTKV
ncbi:piggyBac transposable element-derived protein 3-like [Myzus persicae]|uniref:piggyBac transposable element-derived protein 3-like n=1 Tax=Myzus persicae TaxID=13164 RepID=UPI000B935EDA|nr:piggyBac transposable element-derived protein 3-like [Myzus persicae]